MNVVNEVSKQSIWVQGIKKREPHCYGIVGIGGVLLMI